ncbi:hypothetical protein PCC79_14930 [Propioniciclava soli]|uniref:CD225/dispanin family protein n=1 Tax=Propioniciclava soli TaxID=2775081 RepID=A0ABZ3C5Z8_9ACTN
MTYQPPSPPPGGSPYPSMGGEHPQAQKLLIWSIVGLICCAPINIWVLITANGIEKSPGGFDTSKVKTARIIAIVSLVLWAAGIIINWTTGAFTALIPQ